MKLSMLFGASLLAVTACGNNTGYQRKPLPDRVISVAAEDQQGDQATSADLEQGNDESYNKIDGILQDDARISEIASKVLSELKKIEPKVEVSDAYIAELVGVIKSASPKSAEDVTEAVYPSIQDLFKTDPKLADSSIKELVLNAPSMVKPQLTAKIQETLNEESN